MFNEPSVASVFEAEEVVAERPDDELTGAAE